MPVEIQDVLSGFKLGVDANKQARVIIYDSDGQPLVADDRTLRPDRSGLIISGYNDDVVRNVRVGMHGGVALRRVTQPIFQDLVDGAAVNTQQWIQTLTTMTAVQAARAVTLNAGNSVATTTVATHTSIAQFSKVKEAILRLSARVRFNWTANNATIQLGFGVVGTTVEQPVNGIFFRITTSGQLQLVYANASVDTAVLDIGSFASFLATSTWYEFDLLIFDDACRVVIKASNGATPIAPAVDETLNFVLSQATDTAVRALPVFLRVLNVAAPSTASQLLYSGVAVEQMDVDDNRLFSHSLARCGRGTTLNPASGAQLANYANSAAPASATLSNTAAGYTTLAGQFQWAAVGGAETDYALFGFTVPVGYTLHVTAVRIDLWVMVAAIATTPTLVQWFIDRATAVTLATNSFRKGVGAQSLAIGAVPGTLANPVLWTPGDGSPFIVDSGQIFHLACKMPVSTATATQIIRGIATVDGYLE